MAYERSKSEIERLILRAGADRFISGSDATQAFVAFQHRGKTVKFVLPLPQKTKFHKLHLWEQARRSRYRALGLVIKSKLEAVESGITTFEAEFLAHFVLPNGQTFGDHAIPRLEAAVTSGQMPQLQIGWTEQPKE